MELPHLCFVNTGINFPLVTEDWKPVVAQFLLIIKWFLFLISVSYIFTAVIPSLNLQHLRYFKSQVVISKFSFYFIIYLLMRDTKRGRDIGRGRSRLPEGSLMWDSIPEPWDHHLTQRQMLNHWATQMPLHFKLFWSLNLFLLVSYFLQWNKVRGLCLETPFKMSISIPSDTFVEKNILIIEMGWDCVGNLILAEMQICK